MNQTEAVAISSKSQDTVTQAELREVIDLQNRVEILAAGIRRRLEAGAGLEQGALGASTCGCESLESIAQKSGIGTADRVDGFGILDIGPASYHAEFRNKYPAEVWA